MSHARECPKCHAHGDAVGEVGSACWTKGCDGQIEAPGTGDALARIREHVAHFRKFEAGRDADGSLGPAAPHTWETMALIASDLMVAIERDANPVSRAGVSEPDPTKLQDLATYMVDAGIKPACWFRTKNGKLDWNEDCVGTSREDVIDGWKDYGDEYDAIPLYTRPANPAPVAGDAACEHLSWFVTPDNLLRCGRCHVTRPRGETLGVGREIPADPNDPLDRTMLCDQLAKMLRDAPCPTPGCVDGSIQNAGPDPQDDACPWCYARHDLISLTTYGRESLAADNGLDELLASVAGVPCRFCHGPGSDTGRCPDCGKPRGE